MLNGYKSYIGAALMIIPALMCFLQHINASDLGMHWQECLAMLGGGTGIVGLRSAIGRQMAAQGVK